MVGRTLLSMLRLHGNLVFLLIAQDLGHDVMLQWLEAHWQTSAFGIACHSRFADRMLAHLAEGTNPTLVQSVSGVYMTPFQLCLHVSDEPWASSINSTCCDIIKRATSWWCPASHFLFPQEMRRCVQRTMMLASKASTASDQEHMLPKLPLEIWLHIASFIPRTVTNPFAFV